MAWKLVGLLLALAGAKMWLAEQVPWFVGLPMLGLGLWLFFGRPGLNGSDANAIEGTED